MEPNKKKAFFTLKKLISRALDMSKVLLLISFFASSTAYICPENSSDFNERAVFAKISKYNWSMIATSDDQKKITDRPMDILLDTTMIMKTKLFYTEMHGHFWQRLRFNFFCGDTIVKFTEFAKIYSKYHGKLEDKTICRYCYYDKISVWKNIFISHNSDENILMFYICDENFEVFTIFGHYGTLNSAGALKVAQPFLKNFESSILEKRKLIFLRNDIPLSDCEGSNFDICTKPNEINFEDDETLENMKVPNEFSVTILVIMFSSIGSVLIVTMCITLVMKIGKRVWRNKDVTRPVLFVRSNSGGVATIFTQ